MFAVIYRNRIKPNKEKEFKKLWHDIAEDFIKNKGAFGSCLHRTQDGDWLAYSRWPSKKARDEVWPKEGSMLDTENEINKKIVALKDCMEGDYTEECLEILDDLLLTR